MRLPGLLLCGLLLTTPLVAAEPEVVTLSELPANSDHSGPWPSSDGLTLYWQSIAQGERQRWIWSAERATPEALFSNPRKLLVGSDPTVSGDGHEMVLLEGGKLKTATRTAVSEAFNRPRSMPEFDGYGFLAAPCLSDDALTLYAEHIYDGKNELTQFTRPNRQSPWGNATVVNVKRPGPAAMRFFHLPAGEKWAFGSIPDRLKDPNSNNLVVFSVAKGALESPTFITHPNQTIQGAFPRYVASTRELFFSRDGARKGEGQILVIRNYEPRSSQ